MREKELLMLDCQREVDTHVPTNETLELWVNTALEMAGYLKPAEMTLRFTTNEEVHTLNRDFRGKDKPTNVLSFPFEVPDFLIDEEPILGDIIIAMPVIEAEAQEQQKTIHDHLAHMTVHGTLHLLGFDHIEDEEAEEMEALEIQILNALGIANPYEEDDLQ